MKKFRVFSTCREVLETKVIEAETAEEAQETYQEIQEGGNVAVVDYADEEFHIEEVQEKGKTLKKFQVKATGTEVLATKVIEANTREEAEEKYRDLWAEGQVEAFEYEMGNVDIREEGEGE